MMIDQPRMILLCAIGGGAGGVFLAFLKPLARYQGTIALVMLASCVGACLMNDHLRLLPNATLQALSPIAINCAAAGLLPFFGAWLLTFLGQKFWRDLEAYAEEKVDLPPRADSEPPLALPPTGTSEISNSALRKSASHSAAIERT